MANLKKDMAYRADDTNFDDFDQAVYDKCILIAQRKTAKRYNLIQRLYSFVATNFEDDCDADKTGPQATKDIMLPMTNFVSEYEVLVNEEVFHKVDRLTIESENEYVLERNHNSIVFNFYPRVEKAAIKIYYTSDMNEEDSDIEELEPIIPTQYYEETLALGLVELAKYGIVKFGGSTREAKFKNILSIYAINERDLDKELLPNNTWACVEVYRVY